MNKINEPKPLTSRILHISMANAHTNQSNSIQFIGFVGLQCVFFVLCRRFSPFFSQRKSVCVITMDLTKSVFTSFRYVPLAHLYFRSASFTLSLSCARACVFILYLHDIAFIHTRTQAHGFL